MQKIRSFRDISIRHKLTLVIMLTSGCGLLLAGSLIVLYERGAYRSTMAEDLSALAQIIGDQSTAALNFSDPRAAQENLAALQRKPEIISAAIYNAQGKLFAGYSRTAHDGQGLPKLARAAGYQFKIGQLELFQPIDRDGEKQGTVYLCASLSRMQAHLAHDVGIVAGGIVVLLLITLLLSGAVQRAISDPILALARVAQVVSRDKDYSIRASGEGRDEIGNLIVTFNQMLTRIEEADDALRGVNGALQAEVIERERADLALRAKSEELRTMTQQLWHSAKLATMGELAASIAHELNNPMATVTLKLESLMMDLDENDPARRQLQLVDSEIERMSGLVARLLQFSRRGSAQTSTVVIPGEIDRTLELVHSHLSRRNIEVVTQFETTIPTVHADRQQLQQLFLNLFTNAGDAMAAGGTLTVHVRREGDTVVTEVCDTGEGIAPENLPLVTEPFFTTKPEGKGTGLGLGICRRIVLDHHGNFSIDSTLGVGTTVRVVLPAGQPPATTAFDADPA